MIKKKQKSKRGMGKRKGSSYEREVCKLLSLWWTDEERDDVFWRTASSGGRATQRSKTNQSTFGQYGDVQATDPIGQPLIDVCPIEIKRGYNKDTFSNLIEKSNRSSKNPTGYENFLIQCINSAVEAGSPAWLLISQRDNRNGIISMPYSFYKKLKRYSNIEGAWFYTKVKLKGFESYKKICLTTFNNFLQSVSPNTIISMQKQIKNKQGDTDDPKNKKRTRRRKSV